MSNVSLQLAMCIRHVTLSSLGVTFVIDTFIMGIITGHFDKQVFNLLLLEIFQGKNSNYRVTETLL